MDRHILATPIGGIELRMENGRLSALNLTGATPTEAPLDGPLVKELERYFAGEPVRFDGIPLDLAGCTDFEKTVYDATRMIPFGNVASYGQVAKAIGMPGAARAVGQALGKNPVAIVIPCHRLVGATGALTGYAGGLERKRWLLAHEGVEFAQ